MSDDATNGHVQVAIHHTVDNPVVELHSVEQVPENVSYVTQDDPTRKTSLSMTPEQARGLAETLNEAADKLQTDE